MSSPLYSSLFVISCISFNCWCQAAQIEDNSPCTSPQPGTNANGPQYFPNIERIGNGYDVYTGNPHEVSKHGVDPGYKLAPVFIVTYKESRETSDRKYFLPDYVDVVPSPSCLVEDTAHSIRDMSEYRKVLDLSVAFGISVPGARFGASFNYEKVNDVLTTHESQYYFMSAFCTSYSAALQASSPDQAQLSDEFIADVKDLVVQGTNPEDTYNSYQGFIEKYGTEYVSSVTMGGLYGMRYKLSTNSVVKMVSEGFSVSAVATATFEDDVSVSGKTTLNITKTQIHTFQESTQENTTHMVGGCPSSSTGFNIKEWFESVEVNPQPVKYDLKPLSSLLTSTRFPNDSYISKKKAHLDEAVRTYCDDLNLQFCSTEPPGPPPQISTTLYTTYKAVIGDNSFYIPSLHSTDHKIVGVLLSCNFHGISQPTIVVDGNSASHEVIRPAIGWNVTFVNHHYSAFFRPQCDQDFTSVSDFVVKCNHDCSQRDPSTWINDLPEEIALPCISTRCLGQCQSSHCTDLGGGVVKGFTDGHPQFGANSDICGASFYRYGSDLRLDSFLCLTTVCLDGY